MKINKTLQITAIIMIAIFWVSVIFPLAQDESQQQAVIFAIGLDQEPGNVSLGSSNPSGTGAFVISGTGSHIGITFTYSDLTGPAAAMHVHNAPAGENGSVVQTICGGGPPPALLDSCPSENSGTIAAVWAIPSDLLSELLDGDLYVNIHTSSNGGGEIRGQLVIGEE